MDGAANPRANCTVRKFSSFEEADRADLEYWAKLTPEQRLELCWRLSLEQHKLAGLCDDEPRLDRSAIRVIRR